MQRTPTNFISIPQNPTPYGGKCFYAATSDGNKLRVATFPCPADKKERANVLVATGRSEFIEKYFEIVTELQARGFGVTVMDWRGQGLSSRLLPITEKGHINTFDTFVADLRMIADQVSHTDFSSPRLLLTHSMGGLPALQLLAKGGSAGPDAGYDGFVGAVLSAPMTRLFSSASKRKIVRLLSRGAVRAGFARQSLLGVKEYSLEFKGNILTTDKNRHARFRALQAAAPNATISSPTYGWLKAATDAIDEIHDPAYMANLKTPVLIVSAEHDTMIDSTDHEGLAQNNETISCLTLKNALHEILMESDPFREQFWHAFDNFVNPLLAQSS